MKLKDWFSRYQASFSYIGLVFAVLFFAASLSPSLLPRNYIVQGLLSGIELAVGYGVGCLFVWVWKYLELPEFGGKATLVGKRAITIFAA
ncbi:MAG: alpha/beta-hydrolase N-terminal domain-containing protein, partial [Lacipirellulaceae bacterium]